jgi:peptide chain release factor subunit 1
MLYDVTNQLNSEYGTASNIKSKTTRKNVMEAITKTVQRLKMIENVPETGLVIFTGAVPQNGIGTEKLEQYLIVPPNPINIYKYLCSSEFFLEPLEEQLKEKDTYGLVVMDRGSATLALLSGNHLEILKTLTSGAPSRHDAGGQSARRFERIIEQMAHEFNVRVGEYCNNIFLDIPDLKGMIVGGPGPTKEKFAEGSFLDYRLKDKILAVLDTGYTDEPGIKELLSRSEDTLKDVRYMEEKNLVQKFLKHLSKDDGLAVYGQKEVMAALELGSVDLVLVSDAIDIYTINIKCSQCKYFEEKNIKEIELENLRNEVSSISCPECNSDLYISSEKNLIDEISEIADQTSSKVEIISTETEEGVQLLNFGGIAGILRYRM